ncbi:hypothetical protein GIB67_005278 [Kingdonia uniflora]|uniref:C2 domain-containing protein n=1 Tax=Kingdonia uniflora TaxID=39325 RepID=A0A7J7NNC7_9MAGN|nr:hypothetical protein GIB67_005278 [Kingdonia uniflora]
MQRPQSPDSLKDYALKETASWLGRGKKLSSTYDLVEQMQYLYGTSRHFEEERNLEWNQVFAFLKERIQASGVDVLVKDLFKDDFVGKTIEVFPEAWHSDTAGVSGDGIVSIRSKVYFSPKLWYLRVNVIEAQDLHLSESRERGRFPEVYVKAYLGNNALRTKTIPRRLDNKAVNTKWYNLEKHVVVVDEEKKEKVKFANKIHLQICLEGGNHVLDESTEGDKDKLIGKVRIRLSTLETDKLYTHISATRLSKIWCEKNGRCPVSCEVSNGLNEAEPCRACIEERDSGIYVACRYSFLENEEKRGYFFKDHWGFERVICDY